MMFAVSAQVPYNTIDSAVKRKFEQASLNNKRESDSLQKVIAQQNDDTFKVLNLLRYANLLQNDTANLNLAAALQAKLLAEKLNFKPGIARALSSIANVYECRRNYTMAIHYFQKAAEAGEHYRHYMPEDNFYSSLLNLYFYLGNYPDAASVSLKQLAVAEKNNNVPETALYNNLLGYINYKQGNYAEAEDYYSKYINLAKQIKDSLMLGHAYSESSEVFVEKKDYRKALSYLFAAKNIYATLMQAYKDINSSHTNYYAVSAARIVKVNFQTGRVYKLMNILDSALDYSMYAVEGSKKEASNSYDVASFYINAGDVYRLQGNNAKAVELLKMGLSIAVQIMHKENERDACNYLSLIYRQQKRYDSAFIYFSRYTELKDSIVNNETKSKIAQVQAQYNVAKKDKEISRQQQVRNIIIGCFVLALLLLLFFYNRYRYRQKNIFQQTFNRQQNELFNAVVTTQDKERKRIAQDIHDSLGSVLSAAKLKLSSIEDGQQTLTENQRQKYVSVLQLLDEASAELRNISHNIMPAALSKLGLVAALNNFISKIPPASGIAINFSAYGFEKRLHETTELSLYRIALELINNTIKHAAATRATLQLIQYPDYINITMEDNGRGFDFEKTAEQKKGMGLGNIISRVSYLNGVLNADAAPGKGTTIIIDIPYNN